MCVCVLYTCVYSRLSPDVLRSVDLLWFVFITLIIKLFKVKLDASVTEVKAFMCFVLLADRPIDFRVLE